MVSAAALDGWVQRLSCRRSFSYSREVLVEFIGCYCIKCRTGRTQVSVADSKTSYLAPALFRCLRRVGVEESRFCYPEDAFKLFLQCGIGCGCLGCSGPIFFASGGVSSGFKLHCFVIFCQPQIFTLFKGYCLHRAVCIDVLVSDS